MHAVLFIGNSAVVACSLFVGLRCEVTNMSKAIPLARRLRIPPVQNIVMARGAVVARYFVFKALTAKEWRVGLTHVPIHRKNCATLHQLCSCGNSFGGQQVQATEIPRTRCGPDVP